MTIIEPKKNKLRLNFAVTAIMALILLGSLLIVFAYNRSVSMNYKLSETLKSIESLRVANAELKNSLYVILDLQNVEKLADKLGLVKEKRPDYLSINR